MMKKERLISILALASLFVSTRSIALEVTPRNTKVEFSVINFLITTAHGKFKSFSGRLDLKKPLSESVFQGTIQVDSIDTDSPKRDAHLKEADFFDAEKFPEMVFKSTRVEGEEKNFVITGDLTLRGVTRQIQLSASMVEGKLLRAEGKINRQEFGMNSGATIKNEVNLKIEVNLDEQG
jgi:polyisoprenoid-binding protein YceI